MKDWLVKMAQQQQTSEEQLQAALESLPSEELQKLALDLGIGDPAPETDAYSERLEEADRMGRELAVLHGSELAKLAEAELEKEAWAPLLAGAARLLPTLARGAKAVGGAMGGARGIAKNVIQDKVTSGVGNAISRARMPSSDLERMAAGGGGFKYASVRELYIASLEKQAGWAQSLAQGIGSGAKGNSFLRSTAGMMMRDPRRAMALAGAGVGAAQGLLRDPGYDEHGNKRSRLGAAAKGAIGGGAVGYGVGHFSQGARGAVQGLGKDLSKDLRAHSYRNLKGPLGRNAAAPASTVNIVPNAASAASAASAAPDPTKILDPISESTRQRLNAQNVASDIAHSEGGVMSKMRNMLMGQRGINVPLELQNPEKVVLSSARFEMLSPVDRIKLSMLKQASMGGAAAKMFSTNIPTNSSRLLLNRGAGGAAASARRAVPPPIPAAARRGGGASPFAVPAGPSPFAAPARRPAGGLAGVQQQLNSARSIAGGGLPGTGGSQITAMPGSGW